ncbi:MULTISPECIES: DUF2017 domain-containing protein [unclassified Streptomyces]|uniref:DUF2017 domain-containing protein n=1 Tax=unclassified Streptomyces TaxID=2593676 RepID=UPI0022B6253D|nr:MULTISPECIES: DUF2017 domain-containing protein [unclassified Streptomyces]MCZ7414477.1 DUF2017 domain-containing protein [Streptomyces sp. WMMC897]MCZ7431433.1 DUF2017 domain-containing protein [Streptomyces sp. WMMC1477]
MAAQFEPSSSVPGGAAIGLDELEISILRSLAVQLLELIGPGDEAEAGDDPLAELFADGPSEPPSDPALARLFPDAYTGPGERQDRAAREAGAEFRRFTENELRDRKRADGLAVVHTLDTLRPAEGSGAAVLTLTPQESRQWLGALNDLRLTIGTRLEVEDDADDLYRLSDDDPRKPLVMAYLWLGALQESLVATLMP